MLTKVLEDFVLLKSLFGISIKGRFLVTDETRTTVYPRNFRSKVPQGLHVDEDPPQLYSNHLSTSYMIDVDLAYFTFKTHGQV